MTEKGEEMGGGGGGGGRRRERAELWNIYGFLRKKRKNVLDSTLEKEEGFQFQTSQGMNEKTAVPGGKTISRISANSPVCPCQNKRSFEPFCVWVLF